MLKIVKWMIFFMIILGITACQRSRNPIYIDDEPLPKKIEGTSDKRIIELQHQLNKQNIRVISIGQNYLVSIPSDRLFMDQSPQLTWNAYSTLNPVIEYLNQFRIVSLYVRGFSSQYVSAKRERALTLSRARAVADYLDQQGVDSRLIITSGLGSDKPIMKLRQGGDHSGNSRIEITFRKQVA